MSGPHRGSGGREYFVYEGLTFEDGCLIKIMSTRGLKWDESVVPSLAELDRFKAGLGMRADEELLEVLVCFHQSAIYSMNCPSFSQLPSMQPQNMSSGLLFHELSIVFSTCPPYSHKI